MALFGISSPGGGSLRQNAVRAALYYARKRRIYTSQPANYDFFITSDNKRFITSDDKTFLVKES